MGCTQSKDIHNNSQGRAVTATNKSKKKSKELVENSHSLDEQELHKKKEDILLQRHDSEVDILQQISVEREVLRSMCAAKINGKITLEDFMDSLSGKDLSGLHDPQSYIRLYKAFLLSNMKHDLQMNKKIWLVS